MDKAVFLFIRLRFVIHSFFFSVHSSSRPLFFGKNSDYVEKCHAVVLLSVRVPVVFPDISIFQVSHLCYFSCFQKMR